MKVLLDENFGLPLYHRLRSAGCEVPATTSITIITLGQRGVPDRVIRQRLAMEDLVFLTQDTEFLDSPGDPRAAVIVSRVSQNLPIAARVELWFGALERFILARPAGTVFELLDTGEIVAWEVKGGS